jgi:16S rRNA methyltransferase RsmB/F
MGWENQDSASSLQLRILQRAMRMLRPGGKIVYSTCFLNPVENEAMVAEALRTIPGMLLPVSLLSISYVRSGFELVHVSLNARRVSYRARKSYPPTTCRHSAPRTTPSAAGATLPHLTEAAHALSHKKWWGWWKGGGVGLSQRNSVCLLALVPAATFLAGQLFYLYVFLILINHK